MLTSALLDLVLPQQCAGCEQPGTGWCGGCEAEVTRRRAGPAYRTAPDPVPASFPDTWCATSYDGPVRQVVVAHKDRGRVDLRPALARWWRDAVAAAVAQDEVLERCLRRGEPVLVVPAPSSARAHRERGRDPWLEVTREALTDVPGLPVGAALRQVRRVADQAGLDAAGRRANVRGAMAVRRPEQLRGRACLLSDDVVTTGSTLAEAARALREAGARHVAAAVLAATRRRT